MIELDHVVYFSEQPPEILAKEREGTSIGGRHKHWGTVNALTYTRDSYIEYLSVEDAGIARNANHPLINLLLNDLEEGEGWGTICFRTADIQQLNERLQEEGWETSGVLEAERETSSGFIRKWKMLFIEQAVTDELPYPFFIEWDESFEDRMRSLREDGTIKAVNENLHIARCIIHVHDPAAKVEKWAKLLGMKVKGHSLLLPNTVLVFEESAGEKERLNEVKLVNIQD